MAKLRVPGMHPCRPGVSTVAMAMVVFGLLCGLSRASHADTLTSPSSFVEDGTAKINYSGDSLETAASQSQYVSPPDTNNVANVTNINAAAFFGFSDWLDNGQTQINSNASSGTWSISNVNFDTYDYLIAFKDGAGTNLIAFLLNEETASGDWTTPFVNPPFTDLKDDQSKAVSHFTIAKRNAPDNYEPPPVDDGNIPEPASLSLLALGGASLVLARRARG